MIFTLLLLFCNDSVARPEYAIRYNQNRCTSCHYQPTGGGPKNWDGKLFQNRAFRKQPHTLQKYFSSDFRGLYYHPESPKMIKGGMGVMSGSLAAHIPLDDEQRIRLILEHNLVGFAAAPYRDSYLRYDFNQKQTSWLDSIIVGRFRPAFGITSEEHRTYTRIQTGTQWYTFDTGLMLSGTPYTWLHYDLSIVNGDLSSGQSLKQGQASDWGSVVNVRFMPTFFWLGFSGRTQETSSDYNSYAWSVYSLLSLSRLFDIQYSSAIKLEYARAKGYNSELTKGLASDPNYATSLIDTESAAYLLRLDISLTNRLTFIYKFDYLIPDKDYLADYYQRHGFGVRWALAPSVNLQLRSEAAQATHPTELSKVGILAQDANFVILEVLL